jgi:hypothetical protein
VGENAGSLDTFMTMFGTELYGKTTVLKRGKIDALHGPAWASIPIQPCATSLEYDAWLMITRLFAFSVPTRSRR